MTGAFEEADSLQRASSFKLFRWRKKSTDSDQSDSAAGSKKGTIDPRWKVKIQAIFLIGLLVIPGNLVTLIVYSTSEGNVTLTVV